MTVRDIELFSEMSGDFNPLHYDEEAAVRSTFGRIIVQGGITTSVLNALVAETLPGPGSVFLNSNWNYRAPVAPGDTITARVEVTEVRTDKPLTTLTCEVVNQEGVTVLDGTLLVWTEDLG